MRMREKGRERKDGANGEEEDGEGLVLSIEITSNGTAHYFLHR